MPSRNDVWQCFNDVELCMYAVSKTQTTCELHASGPGDYSNLGGASQVSLNCGGASAISARDQIAAIVVNALTCGDNPAPQIARLRAERRQ